MFIVLEGIDGCGKTTQADAIERWIAARCGAGAVVRTHEPGGWPGGEALRAFLLADGFRSRWTEFLLFMADRCEHAARVISPALADGRIVLCDRYTPSTLAYQILSDLDIPKETTAYLLDMAQVLGLPEPDLVLWLDAPWETAAARLVSRGKRDAFDARGREYFERVRAAYGRLAAEAGGRTLWVPIDASRAQDDVFREITGKLAAFLEGAA